MFHKILIANRGEIAVRIIRTCKEMGIRTVAVYSDIDADSLHVKLADEAYPIGPAETEHSYLNAEKILEVAKKSEAEALHPGYGFLAENPAFVEMCEQSGLTFIGPPSQSMYQVKPKQAARHLMSILNIPVVPGYDETLMNSTSERFQHVQKVAEDIGYPVVIKPSGGGGGIGMMIARNREELKNSVHSVEGRGRKLFGVSSFYVEKLISDIKHIEFQVLADRYGNVVHLGERDCSIQRRFQKLVEEAPCLTLSPHLRMKMAAAALDIALAMKFVNAMTVEFFYVPETREFYFNEVNTRLQVEHCVTELVTDVDIVKEQIRIAAGEPLAFTQDDINRKAWAIECRITAEDVARGFMPSPGQITGLHLPHGPGLRIDEGIYEGYKVPFYYDPLLLKIMTWGKTREEALLRMKRTLAEMKIGGIETNISFHRIVLEDELFQSGHYTTDFVEKQRIVARVREEKRKLNH
ncbi:MAG: biotin carboxylase N-terminal domain-containing protein [Dehalococcoidales bacterium]